MIYNLETLVLMISNYTDIIAYYFNLCVILTDVYVSLFDLCLLLYDLLMTSCDVYIYSLTSKSSPIMMRSSALLTSCQASKFFV